MIHLQFGGGGVWEKFCIFLAGVLKVKIPYGMGETLSSPSISPFLSLSYSLLTYFYFFRCVCIIIHNYPCMTPSTTNDAYVWATGCMY